LAEQYLTPEKIRDYGLFNPNFVRRVRTARPGKRLRWHYFMLYLMLGTHLWIEMFERGIDAEALAVPEGPDSQ